MSDGVGADVHAGRDLVVVQSLGDEASDGPLGVGQAVPPGNGSGGGRGPVAPTDAKLAQPPADAGLVAVGTDLAVSAERLLQVMDRALPVTAPAVQSTEVFRGGRPGPRIRVLGGGLGQASRVTAG